MLIANCDTILFHAVFAGMTIAGLAPFLVSYRNSAAAVVDMMKKTNCSRIVTLHHAHNALVENIRKEIPGRQLVVDELPTPSYYAFPKLGSEIEADPFVPYPVPASRPDLDSPAIYFHSSGSTGFPKPILHTHIVQASWFMRPIIQSFMSLPVSSRIGVMGLPPFHGYGAGVQLYLPLASLVAAVVYAPRAVTDPHAAPVTPTTGNIFNYVRRTGCKALMTVSTFFGTVGSLSAECGGAEVGLGCIFRGSLVRKGRG
jgi:acyl-coenzyme A synthetase/AMP-(fatty) acid ligase